MTAWCHVKSSCLPSMRGNQIRLKDPASEIRGSAAAIPFTSTFQPRWTWLLPRYEHVALRLHDAVSVFIHSFTKPSYLTRLTGAHHLGRSLSACLAEPCLPTVPRSLSPFRLNVEMQKSLSCRRAVSLYELVEVQELHGSLMPVEEGHIEECERADVDLRSCSYSSAWGCDVSSNWRRCARSPTP